MPREQINHPNDSLETEGSWRDPIVQVYWSAQSTGSHVQLSLEVDPGYLQAIYDPDALTTTIYSPALSRSELNKMIKALRRARDSAYGRDE